MRSHNTSFFVFSLVLSLSLLAGSLFYGGNVKAAGSSIFYDGVFGWYTTDRFYSTSVAGSDFQYKGITRSVPFVSGVGEIDFGLASIPFNNNPNWTTTSFPMYATLYCPDVIQNGGRVYMAYTIAYASNPGIETVNNLNTITLYVSKPGSIEYASQRYASATYTNGVNADSLDNYSNTFISNSIFESYSNPYLIEGLSSYSGTNFPKYVWGMKAGATSQLMESYNLSNVPVYDFGYATNPWQRTRVRAAYWDIAPNSNIVSGVARDDYNTIYFDMRSMITGHFHSTAAQRTVYVGDEFEVVDMVYGSLVYIIPIACIAVTRDHYLSVQELLTSVDNNIMALADQLNAITNLPSSEQIAWLNEYQRKSQDAIAQASSMAAAAHYDFSRPNLDSSDLSQYITGEQVRPLTGLIQMFLSHSKILIILTIAVTASIIGYIFFGKRG